MFAGSIFFHLHFKPFLCQCLSGHKKHTLTYTHTHAHTHAHAHTQYSYTRSHLCRTQSVPKVDNSTCLQYTRQMRHYISQTKCRYSGFSPLRSHPDSVVAISDPPSQYLLSMQPKRTDTRVHSQYRYTRTHLCRT